MYDSIYNLLRKFKNVLEILSTLKKINYSIYYFKFKIK